MKFVGLKGRIPVEPLDDERLTNIERRIVVGASDGAVTARAHRAPRFGLALGLAITAVVAVGAGFAGWQLRGGGSTTVVAAAPVHVRTTDQHSVLDIGDATIESDVATELAVTRPDGGVLVTMTRGRVELEVGKRGNRAPLVVAAGDTRVIVVGTHFSVDYGDGTGGVDVRVTEGVVRVERAQQEVRVAAGQAWTTKRGVLALAELPVRTARSPRDGVIAATDQVTDDKIEIETQAPDVLHDRKPTIPDARIPTAGTQQPTTPTRPGRPELATRPHEGGGSATSSAAMDLRSLVLAQAVLPPQDVGVKPAEAIAIYRETVISETGDPASLAFYSIAAMQHLKLGRNSDALRTLDAYVRRFVGGKEYKAALWLRVRILCVKAVDDRCRQAAYTYMHQATDTPAARVAEALTLSPR